MANDAGEVSDRPERRAKSGLTEQAADDVRTVARGGAVQIAGQISQRSLTFFFTALITNVLGTALYGLYRQVTQLVGITGQLGLGGFNYASMRWITRARVAGDHGGVLGAARVGIGGAALGSAIFAVLLVALAHPIAGWFEETPAKRDELAELLRIGAIYVPLFALLQVLRYCTQAYKTMVPSIVAGNVIQPVARFGLGAAALAAGLGVAGAVWTLVASVGLAMLAAAFFLARMITLEERRARPRSQAGPMIRFALPQAGASLLGVQVLGLGILVLGVLADRRDVGLFGVALSLQGPGTVFLGGIVNIWAPVVSDLYDRGAIDRLESLYQTINRWIATFSFPVFAALMIESDLFVKIFDAPAAAPVVVILALGNLFYTGTGPTGYVISMTGRPGVNFVNSIVAVGLYVGLGWWAVPRYGVVGMAWVDAFVTALINTARVVEAKILVGVQPFGRAFFKPVAATLVGAAVLLAWKLVPMEGVAVSIAGLCLGALAFLVTLRLLGVDPEEREVFNSLKRRVSRRT